VITLASVLWFTHKPAPLKPEAISEDTKKSGSFELVSKEDREDSLYQEMLKRLIKRSNLRTKTFVLDNFRMVGARNIIDERSIPENISKRFILGTTGYQVEERRPENYYILPVVSTQQISERADGDQ
jgi:hypothetical protein